MFQHDTMQTAKIKNLKKFLLRKKIEDFAKEIGFDLIRFTTAKIEPKYIEAFRNWLAQNHHGNMSYMEKIAQRSDLTKILPGAKSVIVLATNYYYEQPKLKPDHAKVARYAYGRDYHKIIGKNLKKLEAFIKELEPAHQTKSYVDTGPILERALAEQSGMGTIGKNGCVITKEFGSWVFLSEIITTLDLKPEKPPQPKFHLCGQCTKCIDQCPTGAIIAPGVIDSRLCISYLTIENKDKIPPALAKIIKKTKLLYGCDICQEVCPHNTAKQKIHTHPEFSEPQIATDQLDTKKILQIKNDEEFLKIFAGSPLMRAKRKGLQRNAKLFR